MKQANKNISKELTEILTDALASRPDLQRRFSNAVGANPEKLVSLQRITSAQRREKYRLMFTRMNQLHKIKQAKQTA